MRERFLRWMCLLSLLFLAFVLGMAAALSDTAIYRKTRQFYDYAGALWQQYTSDPYSNLQWQRQDTPRSGVTRADGARYFNGLTLFSTNGSQALLVDMAGHTLHRWHLPFSAAFGAPAQPEKDADYTWSGFYAYPDGGLLAVYELPDDTLFGRGLVRLDKDSHVLWTYADNVHHSVDVGPDGTIYTLTQRIAHDNPYGLKQTDPPFMDDYVAILDANGRLIRKISLIGAFLHSPYASFLNRASNRQVTHANEVHYIGPETAADFPFSHAGDLLISLRDLSTIAILDPRTGAVTWAISGFWKRQHDPSLLHGGHMLVFDNHCLGDGCGFTITAVAEFDPLSGRETWSYGGRYGEALGSGFRGAAQRLPNGDTLIVESQHGRMLEVTPQKDVVWEYYNPVHAGKDGEYIAYINDARRFAPGYFTFLAPENAHGK